MAKVCSELVGLAGPFTRIARAMSAEWGVRIVPSGSRCDTDGEMIRIPFTADFLPREMRQALHGMLDHEVCHVAEERRHRKMSRATPVEMLRAETDKRLQLLFNVVEDVRIEKRYSREYVGVAQNLAVLNLQAAGDWAAKNHGAGWWKKFSAALILIAHGLDATWAEDEFGAYLRLVGDELDQMRRGVGEWGDASLDVARRIFDKVKQKHEDAKPKPPKSDEKNDDEGEGGDGDEGEESDGKGDEENPDDEPDSADMLEAIRKGIEDYVVHDAVANHRYVPHPKAQALDAVGQAESNLGVYTSARAEVLPQIRVLRQKQRALVSAWARRRVRPGLDRGDIDEHVLAGVRTGETDLFSELTRKRVLNTAITGLVDFSGSMGADNRMPDNGSYYALRTAVALAESWSALGIANEWLGFTVQDPVLTGITIEDLASHYFCRPPLQHIVIKAFGDTMREACARFGGIKGSGSNVDGEAVIWAWRRLIARREARKILVVISDGQPASWNGCVDKQEFADDVALQTHLRDAVRMVTKSGVEVIGIGAGTDCPRAFYNSDTGAKFVYVRSIATLAMDVFRVMKQRVTDLA
jgi:cobalamin biosynthesis protein CobT